MARLNTILDEDASRLIGYLQRGGTKSYYLTFDADKNAHATWYDSDAAPPAPPAGTDVYFGVHPCTAIPKTNAAGEEKPPSAVRGRREYIAALNCLYAELDDKTYGGTPGAALIHIRSLAAQPSVIIASGGGYHCYWLLVEPFMLADEDARARAVDVQARWTTFAGGDKAAKDIARVLRVPTTLNYKYKPPRPVELVEQDYRRLYTLDELQAMLPAVAPRKARTPRTHAPAGHSDRLQPDVAQPAVDFLTISKAAAALARLRDERRDEYTSWLNVGMALRELGAIGYNLWELWSAASPKYKAGECAAKWTTFRAGVPNSGDITLASLFHYADEDSEPPPADTMTDAERLQLQAYKERDIQTQQILAMKAPLAAKAVWIGMLPPLDAGRVLVANRDGHSGSVAVNYGNFAAIMKTSKSSVANAVDYGQQAGLWRKDAEHKETRAGYDIQAMRLDLQQAFFQPELAQPIEQKRGGARPGAGRKPKCVDCPPRTQVIRKTEITYICGGCGQRLDAEPTRYDVMPDAPADETADEFKHETVDTGGTTTVSCLKNTLDVPAVIADTFDIVAAIRIADTLAPDEDAGRQDYKTGLGWILRGEPAKAAALAPGITDERARGILLHLAHRAPAMALA